MRKKKAAWPRKFTPGHFNVKVKRSVAGLGLFALEDIPKGACIIEYRGKILTKQEEEDSNSLYLFDAGGGVTIDGAPRSNTARYINHSCRPNCEIDIYKRRVFVMAKRRIRAGEELHYDYDKDYWKEYIEPKGCRCIKHAPELYRE